MKVVEVITDIIPVEIWADIAEYDYDVWRNLRSLNKLFHKAVSSRDISGRFDYVIVNETGECSDRARKYFRRLFVVNIKLNEMIMYKHNTEARIIRFNPVEGNDPVWNISSISRTISHINGENSYDLYEFVLFVGGNHVKYCNRNLMINGEDCIDESYTSTTSTMRRWVIDGGEEIVVMDGEYADFSLNSEFYLYNARNGVVG
ncbi:hypothetical protein PRJ_Fausto_00471 [Faustovirus]|nr:hypothetical protein PRJ_Fausto_00471 [Faustovirus]QBR98927.1 hypothetical protein [Faustovirus mariensis]